MIVNKNLKPARPIELDLSGPDGNVFQLFAFAKRIGRQLGYTEQHIEAIIAVMMYTNYEGALHTFDTEFGDFVILYR